MLLVSMLVWTTAFAACGSKREIKVDARARTLAVQVEAGRVFRVCGEDGPSCDTRAAEPQRVFADAMGLRFGTLYADGHAKVVDGTSGRTLISTDALNRTASAADAWLSADGTRLSRMTSCCSLPSGATSETGFFEEWTVGASPKQSYRNLVNGTDFEASGYDDRGRLVAVVPDQAGTRATLILADRVSNTVRHRKRIPSETGGVSQAQLPYNAAARAFGVAMSDGAFLYEPGRGLTRFPASKSACLGGGGTFNADASQFACVPPGTDLLRVWSTRPERELASWFLDDATRRDIVDVAFLLDHDRLAALETGQGAETILILSHSRRRVVDRVEVPTFFPRGAMRPASAQMQAVGNLLAIDQTAYTETGSLHRFLVVDVSTGRYVRAND